MTTANSPNGARQLVVRGDSNGSVKRAVNMTGVTNARLKFSWKAKTFEDGDVGYVKVYDGSWHTVLTVNNDMDDNTFHSANINLSGYNMDSNFNIRIHINANGKKDFFYVDDIEITGYK